MRADEIIGRLERLGVVVTLNNDKVRLKPGSRVPKELAKAVSLHKQEVIAYLKTRGMNDADRFKIKFPNCRSAVEEELEEISHEVEATGYVLLWSTELDDFVAFHSAGLDITRIPPYFVPYSEKELWYLFGDHGDGLTLEALKLVHSAKKQGARVADSFEEEPK